MLARTPKALKKGDDGGCFAAALTSVREHGGVLEHPEASHAWTQFELMRPPHSGFWVVADWFGGWTCCVEQGHFGHRSRKKTWLYANGVDLPSMAWGKSAAGVRMDAGFHSKEERRRASRLGTVSRLSRYERAATPLAFRDLLLSIARTARRPT